MSYIKAIVYAQEIDEIHVVIANPEFFHLYLCLNPVYHPPY